MAAPRYLTLVAGLRRWISAITSSSGAGDAEKIVATNTDGVIDPTLLNATDASAGAGDAGKTVILDGTGKLSETMLPTGIGPDAYTATASEALSAGDFINIWDDAGTPKVRKADGTATGKRARGFVLAAVSSSAMATYYTKGTNDQLTGMTPGATQFLGTTAGARTETAPSAGGNVIQELGVAVSATAMDVELGDPVEIA